MLFNEWVCFFPWMNEINWRFLSFGHVLRSPEICNLTSNFRFDIIIIDRKNQFLDRKCAPENVLCHSHLNTTKRSDSAFEMLNLCLYRYNSMISTWWQQCIQNERKVIAFPNCCSNNTCIKKRMKKKPYTQIDSSIHTTR